MSLGLAAYFIVCPLIFLSGVVDAIGGGGGIISLPAYTLLAGLPPQLANGSNKLSSSVGTAVSTAMFVRRGFVEWKTALSFVVSALIGAAIGARITLLVPDRILEYGLLVVLPVVALGSFRKRDAAGPEGETARRRLVVGPW